MRDPKVSNAFDHGSKSEGFLQDHSRYFPRKMARREGARGRNVIEARVTSTRDAIERLFEWKPRVKRTLAILVRHFQESNKLTGGFWTTTWLFGEGASSNIGKRAIESREVGKSSTLRVCIICRVVFLLVPYQQGHCGRNLCSYRLRLLSWKCAAKHSAANHSELKE